MMNSSDDSPSAELFRKPEWYDRSINWEARLGRELPLLCEVLGPPGGGGLLDAGCGTGRQAAGMASRGYRVTGLDRDAGMLDIARRRANASNDVRFIEASFSDIPSATAGGFDGVYCLGNSLAAAGSLEASRDAFLKMGGALRVGGRLFVQVLNFWPMRDERPCVRGPRVVTRDGFEYVSVRLFDFEGSRCRVTNVTLWNDGGWRQFSGFGTLHAVEADEVSAWSDEANLRIDALYGDYTKSPFDPDRSQDLLVVATRKP